MISEDDYDVIVGVEPDIAFVRLEKKYRAAFRERVADADSVGQQRSASLEYLNHIVATAQALGFSQFDVAIPIDAATADFNRFMQSYMGDVDRFNVTVQIRYARGPKKEPVLSSAEKQKIRHYVEQIKAEVDASDLDTDKKERLYDLINAFLKEIDRDRTPYQRFSELMVGLAHLAGDMATEAEPTWKWVRMIGSILGANQEEERRKLPKSKSPKQLEHHKAD